MKNQEIFEKVAIHLFFQGIRSANNCSGVQTCLYRGPNGTKCAVGHLIPDHLYEISMEYLGVDRIIDQDMYPEIHALLGKNLLILSDLQNVHDDVVKLNWKSTENMRKALRKVGRRFKLNYKFLNNLCFSDR